MTRRIVFLNINITFTYLLHKIKYCINNKKPSIFLNYILNNSVYLFLLNIDLKSYDRVQHMYVSTNYKDIFKKVIVSQIMRVNLDSSLHYTELNKGKNKVNTQLVKVLNIFMVKYAFFRPDKSLRKNKPIRICP